MNPYDSYWRAEADNWRNAYDTAQVSVRAACVTVGAASYLLSAKCPYSNTERLVLLAQAIADLRASLDLGPRLDVLDEPVKDFKADADDAHGGAEGGERL